MPFITASSSLDLPKFCQNYFLPHRDSFFFIAGKQPTLQIVTVCGGVDKTSSPKSNVIYLVNRRLYSELVKVLPSLSFVVYPKPTLLLLSTLACNKYQCEGNMQIIIFKINIKIQFERKMQSINTVQCYFIKIHLVFLVKKSNIYIKEF